MPDHADPTLAIVPQKRRRAVGAILLSLPGKLLRADWSGRGGALQIEGNWQLENDDLTTPEEIITAAIRLAGRLPKQVLVLSSSLSTQVLDFPNRGVANRSDVEWQMLLSEEIAAFTGLPAFESVLGFTRLPMSDGQRRFWVCQGSHTYFTEWEQALHSRGCRRISLAHPGGMALSSATARQCLPCAEYWPDTILCMDRADNRRLLEIITADPTDAPARAQAALWLNRRDDASPTPLLLSSSPGAPPLIEGMREISLADPTIAGEWLKGWARASESSDDSLPIIVAPRRPLPQRVKMLFAALTSLLLLALIGAHFTWTRYQIEQAKVQLGRLSAPQEELKKLEARAATAETARASSAAEAESFRLNIFGALSLLERQGQRSSMLLPACSRAIGEDTVLKEISHAGDNTTVHGIAASPEAADTARSKLLEILRPLGWRIGPASKVAMLLREDGGPWEFEIILTPELPPLPPQPPSTRRKP